VRVVTQPPVGGERLHLESHRPAGGVAGTIRPHRSDV